MPALEVETPEGVTLRYELAGAGARAAAGLVDLFLIFAVWLLGCAFFLLVSVLDESGVTGFFFGLLIGGALLIPALYQIAWGIFWQGQSPGKRLLGLRVTDAHGYPASALQHVLRGIFFPLEALLLSVLFPVGLVVITATERRQRLGDLVAGTVVLRDRPPAESAEPFPRSTWSKLETHRLALVPALAARLDAEDLRFLRDLLARRDLERKERARLLRSSARHYLDKLGIELDLRRVREDAPEILREIYLFLRELRGTPAVAHAEPATAAATSAPDRAGESRPAAP
ncbi:MAG: RDD family protein [Planctomycetota bacterium]|nr:RDD family protein [Planctomycetota bacterium]